MSPRRPIRRRLSVAAASLLTLTLVPVLSQLPADARPVAVPGVDDLVRTLGDPVAALPDVDRRGKVAPLTGQRAAVDALGPVTVRWNDLGTPASLLPGDGSLGAVTSTAPGDAVPGARDWLRDHAAAFGLSAAQVDGLEVVNAQRLAGSDARAVLFRQQYDGLPAAAGGLVTVGVASGQVAYVSSSLARSSTTTLPDAVLSPVQGWLAAAADVGQDGIDAAAVEETAVEEPASTGWTRLSVPGLAQEQQVRLRALPLADGTVRPVFEANVVDVSGGSTSAYTSLVDAVSGEVLVRRNQVDNFAYNNLFTGTITATECGTRHAFELEDDLTRSINAAAVALPADDVTIKIWGPGDTLLGSYDLGTSPEVASYAADAIPPGTYSVQVCPFDPASVVLGQYAIAVSTSDTAAPAPGQLGFQPRWRYFPANPTLDSPTQTPTNSIVGCWFLPGDGCGTPPGQLANVAAFGPWDHLAAGVASSTTVGNNANTHEAWGSPLTPGGTAQAPVSPTREYTEEFTDAWNNSQCDPAELTPGGNDIEASVTNLFVAHNRMHDFSYYLGFTEDNYNMQTDNGGRGGVAGDPEIGNAQAGALSGGQPSFLGRDNANQITLQDGTPGITNQYLFQPIAGAFYAPCTDGGLDMGIVGHEYTHAISNRMVAGPDEGLTSEQGGAMGESWSDLVAAEYHHEHGYSNGGNIWAVGAYATGNLETAIRDYAIDDNPLNYSDYGFDITGPEVHADGEIWNGTLWEVRQALVDAYDASFDYEDAALQLQCAQATKTASPTPAGACPGNRRWLQLIFDSFLLQQGATSMLDARDAMIAADQMRFAGANRDLLWRAFARRGMGDGASVTSGDDHEPVPSFAAPGAGNSTVTFATTGESRLYVGDFEARVSPVADTVGSTPLGASAEFTAGDYDLLAVSPDHGFTRFTLSVPAGGGDIAVRVADDLNVASAAAGATVIGATEGSLNPEHLIDGTEATNWGGVTADNVDVSNPSVAVDLAGATQTVRRVNVSAYLTPAPASDDPVPLAQDDPDSGSRFTALRQFALEACTADCGSASATWARFYTSPADAFPSVKPRPVAPTLTMRGFDVPDTEAAAVRLVTLHNQCTGGPDYAGEQDADPVNDTDCATASDRGTIVHAAELQVFAAETGTTVVVPGTIPPTTVPTTPATPTTTPGATPTQTTTPSTTAARVSTRVRLRVFRSVQTRANAAPQLRARLRLDGAREDRLGRWIVKLDGRRYRLFTVDRLTLRLRVTRPLAPGRHRVRVFFRPADRTAYAPSKSAVVRIVVRR